MAVRAKVKKKYTRPAGLPGDPIGKVKSAGIAIGHAADAVVTATVGEPDKEIPEIAKAVKEARERKKKRVRVRVKPPRISGL